LFAEITPQTYMKISAPASAHSENAGSTSPLRPERRILVNRKLIATFAILFEKRPRRHYSVL
jgi:hypothetical protein